MSIPHRSWQLATTGHRALDAIPGAAPDRVVVDLALPDVDGLTVCRLLRSATATATAEPPIVCMSEAGEAEVRIRTFEQGEVDFVQKPRAGPTRATGASPASSATSRSGRPRRPR